MASLAKYLVTSIFSQIFTRTFPGYSLEYLTEFFFHIEALEKAATLPESGFSACSSLLLLFFYAAFWLQISAYCIQEKIWQTCQASEADVHRNTSQ